MMSAEITESETRERGRILWVDSYDISLDLNRGDKIFGSTSVIRFDCAEPGARVHADLIAKQVHEITLNGVAVDPAAACQDGRIAMSSLAASNELRVVADCAYTASQFGSAPRCRLSGRKSCTTTPTSSQETLAGYSPTLSSRT